MATDGGTAGEEQPIDQSTSGSAGGPHAGSWLDRFIGSMADFPEFEKVIEYGRAFRRWDAESFFDSDADASRRGSMGEMTYRTVEGLLGPDGLLALPPGELPDRPVRVLVTLLESSTDEDLAEPGDYAETLSDYEERLARGEISWQ